MNISEILFKTLDIRICPYYKFIVSKTIAKKKEKVFSLTPQDSKNFQKLVNKSSIIFKTNFYQLLGNLMPKEVWESVKTFSTKEYVNIEKLNRMLLNN